MSHEDKISNEATQTVINFLKSNVPKSDVCKIESELVKDFVLSKRKSKGHKRKPKQKKTRTLTRKEKKHLGFYVIPRNGVKYNDALPIHLMWTEYMSHILELDKPIPNCSSKGWDNFTQTIYKADFHGSMLHVVRSKCPSYVTKRGICIMDTRNTFKIVSIDDKVTTIPKRDCVFEMILKDIKITLFGKFLCVRPAERSTKKVKSHLHPDL